MQMLSCVRAMCELRVSVWWSRVHNAPLTGLERGDAVADTIQTHFTTVTVGGMSTCTGAHDYAQSSICGVWWVRSGSEGARMWCGTDVWEAGPVQCCDGVYVCAMSRLLCLLRATITGR